MAHLLGAEALHLEYPTRVVFDAVMIGLNEGDRIGIVGRNGDGKSSLLGMLAGRIEPSSGRVTRRGGVRMGVLDQSDTLDDDATMGAAVVGARAEHEWAGDPRVRDVITGLVPDLVWDARIGTLSGGQRRRVALAALLVEDWDVIALDEPTNHLDVEGKEMTPAQLLERLGFAREHLSARVGELSGGQKRRLQLLLVLLSEPNVLVLDEPNTQEPYVVLTPPFYRSEGRSWGACRTRAARRAVRLRHPGRTSGKVGAR